VTKKSHSRGGGFSEKNGCGKGKKEKKKKKNLAAEERGYLPTVREISAVKNDRKGGSETFSRIQEGIAACMLEKKKKGTHLKVHDGATKV